MLHEYKVIILDECHTLTSQAWASLLITLEETLSNTIFITTDKNINAFGEKIINLADATELSDAVNLG